MQGFFLSIGAVALAEIGDKTQLLSLMLAARFRKPLPIVAGILVATLANHGFAGAIGSWIAQALGAEVLRWILGISFLAMALWTLVPDKLDSTDANADRLGIFGTTTLAFFLAEMGDKTQVATIALSAQYQSFLPIVMGTTIGMMAANVPVVYLGGRFSNRLPLKAIRMLTAGLFLALGMLVLLKIGI